MLKTGDKTESFVAALVSRFSVAMFGVKYDATADGAKWVGTEVEQAIEISPRQDAGVRGFLTQEVYSQLSLGQELVPHVSGKSGVNDG